MVKKASASKHRDVGWNDDTVSSEGGGDFLGRYTAERGYKDRVRILSVEGRRLPIEVHYHYDQGVGSYFACSRSKTCPGCRRFGSSTSKPRFTAPVLHILRTKVKGKKVKKVGEILKWIFGKDKYEQIRDLVIPELPGANNKERAANLTKVDLGIGCHDQTMQRLTIAPLEGTKAPKDVLKKWKEEAQAEYLRWLEEEFTDESIASHLERVFGSEGKKSKGKGKDADDEDDDSDEDEDIEDSDEADDDDDEEEDEPKKSGKALSKRRAKDEDDDEDGDDDDSDDEESEDDGDEDDGDEDEEEEEKPKRGKKAKPKKGKAKPSKKSAKDDDDDDEDSDGDSDGDDDDESDDEDEPAPKKTKGKKVKAASKPPKKYREAVKTGKAKGNKKRRDFEDEVDDVVKDFK